MKNKFRILILLFSLLIFSNAATFAQAPSVDLNKAPIESTKLQSEPSASQTTTTQSIPEKNAYELTHMKDSGLKMAVIKFFAAMGGVLISVLAIFLGLKLYKKFVLKNNLNLENIDYNKTLYAPKDFKEAINMFLDKTDK